MVEIIDDIDMCLYYIRISYSAEGQVQFTLIRQTSGPTASMIARKSSVLVTSTLTARLDLFLSIVSSRSLAAGFLWRAARWE